MPWFWGRKGKSKDKSDDKSKSKDKPNDKPKTDVKEETKDISKPPGINITNKINQDLRVDSVKNLVRQLPPVNTLRKVEQSHKLVPDGFSPPEIYRLTERQEHYLQSYKGFRIHGEKPRRTPISKISSCRIVDNQAEIKILTTNQNILQCQTNVKKDPFVEITEMHARKFEKVGTNPEVKDRYLSKFEKHAATKNKRLARRNEILHEKLECKKFQDAAATQKTEKEILKFKKIQTVPKQKMEALIVEERFSTTIKCLHKNKKDWDEYSEKNDANVDKKICKQKATLNDECVTSDEESTSSSGSEEDSDESSGYETIPASESSFPRHKEIKVKSKPVTSVVMLKNRNESEFPCLQSVTDVGSIILNETATIYDPSVLGFQSRLNITEEEEKDNDNKIVKEDINFQVQVQPFKTLSRGIKQENMTDALNNNPVSCDINSSDETKQNNNISIACECDIISSEKTNAVNNNSIACECDIILPDKINLLKAIPSSRPFIISTIDNRTTNDVSKDKPNEDSDCKPIRIVDINGNPIANHLAKPQQKQQVYATQIAIDLKSRTGGMNGCYVEPATVTQTVQQSCLKTTTTCPAVDTSSEEDCSTDSESDDCNYYPMDTGCMLPGIGAMGAMLMNTISPKTNCKNHNNNILQTMLAMEILQRQPQPMYPPAPQIYHIGGNQPVCPAPPCYPYQGGCYPGGYQGGCYPGGYPSPAYQMPYCAPPQGYPFQYYPVPCQMNPQGQCQQNSRPSKVVEVSNNSTQSERQGQANQRTNGQRRISESQQQQTRFGGAPKRNNINLNIKDHSRK